ncbi:MAG TPA: hypothetical protein VJK71_02405 [Gemmatimonadales bacterium]|nr:hypothetical protein [Gemmatimonadales bacterium]
MSRTSYAPVLAAALLSVGCLDVSGTINNSFPFDFSVPGSGIGEGWSVAAADVAVDRVTDVAVAGEYGGLPAPYTAFTGIQQAGTNVSGSLFLFHKKWIQSPWSPGRTFRASIDMSFVSNLHSGCTTGPGPVVVIKAGVSEEEPIATADGQGVLRFNLDKGTGAAGGDFVQLGDIRNGLENCPAQGTWQVRNTVQADQPEVLTIDPLGGFWIFFGTESTFSGRHDIYFIRFRVTLVAE